MIFNTIAVMQWRWSPHISQVCFCALPRISSVDFVWLGLRCDAALEERLKYSYSLRPVELAHLVRLWLWWWVPCWWRDADPQLTGPSQCPNGRSSKWRGNQFGSCTLGLVFLRQIFSNGPGNSAQNSLAGWKVKCMVPVTCYPARFFGRYFLLWFVWFFIIIIK